MNDRRQQVAAPFADQLLPGHVALVGAGPGDPGLITRSGFRLLQSADVIVHDRLVSSELLAEIPPEVLLVDVGKYRGGGVGQDEIHRLLIEHAGRGRRVVRLKGGDPFVFGRGAEECFALHAAGIPFVVVPGISSSLAAATAAGVPMTHRGVSRSFAVVTASTRDGHQPDWRALASLDTLVVLMPIANLDEVCERLIDAGRCASTPAVLVARATCPTQREIRGDLGTVVRLARVASVAPPATLVVGRVVDFCVTVSAAARTEVGGGGIREARLRRWVS